MKPRLSSTLVVPKIYRDLDRADKADKRKGWLKSAAVFVAGMLLPYLLGWFVAVMK